MNIREFLEMYEQIKIKAEQLKDVYKEVTGTKGCSDVFYIDNGIAYWEGEFNDSCSCHPEYTSREWSMLIDEVLEIDIEKYREDLTGTENRKREIELEKTRKREEEEGKEKEKRDKKLYEKLKERFES